MIRCSGCQAAIPDTAPDGLCDACRGQIPTVRDLHRMQDRTATPHRPDPMPVIVTDVQMPLWSLLLLMLTWAVAAIPAVFILILVTAFLVGILRGIGLI